MSNKRLTKESRIEELGISNSTIILFNAMGYQTIGDVCKQSRSNLFKDINNDVHFNDMLVHLHANGFLLDSDKKIYVDVKERLQDGEELNFGHFKLPTSHIFFLEKSFGTLNNLCLLTEDSIRRVFKYGEVADEIIFLVKYVGLNFATKEKPKANVKTCLEEFVPLISGRTCNVLKKAKIYTLEQLLDSTKTNLIKIPQFGEESLLDVISFVHGLGYNLKDELEQKKEMMAGQIPLSTSIDDLQHCFSVRIYNCMARGGIHTLGDLVSKRPADLLIIKNFGQSSLKEVENFLERIGYSLNYSLRDEVRKFINRNTNVLDSIPQNEIIPRTPLEECLNRFSVRTYNCLKRGGIDTVEDLVSKTVFELKRIRNMSQQSLKEIFDCVHSLGFTFVDEDKNIDVQDNETKTLQSQVNNQLHENEKILERIEEKRKLLQRYQELMQQRSALIEEEKALDNEIAQILQTLSCSVGEQGIQKSNTLN